MRMSAICAMSQNRVIGQNNQLPWHLPADLQHFKKITLNHPIIMGRKTFESIGRPLPQRCNIILTRDVTFQAPGCVVANSIETALESVKYSDEVFVVGGALLYQQFLPQIEKLYLTIIHQDFEGDAFFPVLNFNAWEEISRTDCLPDENNLYAYSFIVLKKII